MVNIITIASELGYIKIPDNTLIDIDTDEKLSRREACPDHNRKSG